MNEQTKLPEPGSDYILLIEDHAEDGELTTRALRKQGLANQVHWIKDGAEALDFFNCSGAYRERRREHLPHLILLDLQLPKVSGLEILQKIKTDAQLRRIPVVVLTSSTQESDVARSYELGVNSFVSKPVTFDDFSKVVSQLGLYWLMINKPPNG